MDQNTSSKGGQKTMNNKTITTKNTTITTNNTKTDTTNLSNKTTKTNKITKYPNIFCPRSGSKNLTKYGKDQKTKLHKFQCKSCRRQFVPDKNKSLSSRHRPIHGL